MRYGRNREPERIARARQLRKQMSRSERLLWAHLKDQQLGFRFRKQHAFGNYILDFYCAEAALCIEVDGDQHESQLEYDATRDSALAKADILTYRVAADSVFLRTGEILYKIRTLCEERTNKKGFDAFDWDAVPPKVLRQEARRSKKEIAYEDPASPPCAKRRGELEGGESLSSPAASQFSQPTRIAAVEAQPQNPPPTSPLPEHEPSPARGSGSLR